MFTGTWRQSFKAGKPIGRLSRQPSNLTGFVWFICHNSKGKAVSAILWMDLAALSKVVLQRRFWGFVTEMPEMQAFHVRTGAAWRIKRRDTA
jgi:hypothetical protein